MLLSGFDPSIAKAVFNPLDRGVDVTGLHAGSTSIVITDIWGLSASLDVKVQVSAGKAFDSTAIQITGDPAGADFVEEQAVRAAWLISYPQPGARVRAGAVTDSRPLAADDSELVHVPIGITGPDYYPFHQTVGVKVTNLAQPRVPPKLLLVSDYPETITEDGTLFYADVQPYEPARLLYYHYEPPKSINRRVLVKVQNNGIDASLLQLLAGIAGPDSNVLAVGHESTKSFLAHEAAGEGEIFEVPPRATINIVDQMLEPDTVVSGLMQVRVVSGSAVRLAVVVQDAATSPVEPISAMLLSSAVKHARGVYQLPEFFYDEFYTIGGPPTQLAIGKLPLPNLVQGEVLGGDYGVKQSADIALLNPGEREARVGMWFEPRGGRATGTFIVDGGLLQVHAVDAGKTVLLRTFSVPARGYRQVHVVTMPEGGSSYPVKVTFSSQPPAGADWSDSPLVY